MSPPPSLAREGVPPHLIKDSLASGGGILLLGLPRSGTFSTTTAIQQLGYPHAFHFLSILLDRPTTAQKEWESIQYAFNHRDSYTKEDWDNVFGEWQVIGDAGSLFAREMIAAYPNAKVILAQRPFESWSRSVSTALLDILLGSWFQRFVMVTLSKPLLGWKMADAQHDLILGVFRGRNNAEAKASLRTVYDEHYALVRELVPPENLLEYNVEQGWEPLCKFLGKPVPDRPFPHMNETALLKKEYSAMVPVFLVKCCGEVVRRALPVIGFGLGWYAARRFGGKNGAGVYAGMASVVAGGSRS